jgi:RNA polymerase sigma-70 factor (ECF subfamily)
VALHALGALVASAAVTLRGLAGPMSAMAHSAGLGAAPGALDTERDPRLLAALRAGDEEAFATLVRRHHASMKRVARMYVSTDAVAEEVVQETWLAAIAGLERFEQRASLKTWLFHILANKAKTRGTRERRSVPFASLAGADDGPAVPPERFQGEGDAWPGHWATPPRPWEDPERRLQSLEARECLRAAIGALPEVQQAVLTLRDVEGLESEEVCRLLDLSDGNQRVILHRARARVRAELERYFEETPA